MLIYSLIPFPDIKYDICDGCCSLKESILKKYIYFGAIFYVVYFILELCSPIAKILRKNILDKDLLEIMMLIFAAQPYIHLFCESFNYKFVEHEYTNKHGKTRTETRMEREDYYTRSEDFLIYSYRDISGPFILNIDEENLKKKVFIKLDLQIEINFIDTISCYDLSQFRYNIYKKRHIFTKEFEVKVSRLLGGFPKYIDGKYIPINKNIPKFVNFNWYLLFTFLTLGQFYKIYFFSLCHYQTFTTKKVISTRYDLSNDESNAKFDRYNPKINLITKQIDLEPNSYIFIVKERERPLPTELELKFAENYEKDIKKFDVIVNEDKNNVIQEKDNLETIKLTETGESENIDEVNGIKIPLITVGKNV